jgi:hypothetical protein
MAQHTHSFLAFLFNRASHRLPIFDHGRTTGAKRVSPMQTFLIAEFILGLVIGIALRATATERNLLQGFRAFRP